MLLPTTLNCTLYIPPVIPCPIHSLVSFYTYQEVQKLKFLTRASIYQVIRYTVRGKFLVCACCQKALKLKTRDSREPENGQLQPGLSEILSRRSSFRIMYSQISLNGHLCKTDTSMRRTAGAGPGRFSVILP